MTTKNDKSQPPSIEEIRTKIANLVSETFGIDKEKIISDLNFIDIDGRFDSLAMLEMQIKIEEEFGVEFPSFSAGDELPSNLRDLSAIVFTELLKQQVTEGRGGPVSRENE
ncbi:acyl carrier protein [Pandoraea sp. NPDC090278]|uniref:acyl carrier protein n=1 Tax=Pandoraea sp. NPDC090278 TaxID=3364391 RepID=UPI00383BB816